MLLETLMKDSARIAAEHGFNSSFGEAVALMHSELSEMLEEKRAGHSTQELYFRADGKPEGIPAELADLVIRAAGFAERNNIPLVRAIELKQTFNETRPFKHGKEF
jgi:hypothetical protein